MEQFTIKVNYVERNTMNIIYNMTHCCHIIDAMLVQKRDEVYKMEYEIVELEERIAVGVSARTNNQAPNMPIIIGGLWEQFFQKGIYNQIEHKINGKTMGLYSNYENQMYGDYDITVCCEVSSQNNQPEGTVMKMIPAGKYAKFIVRGSMEKAVAEFWTELWNMGLKRTYTGDFEEYQEGGSPEDCEIHILIAIE